MISYAQNGEDIVLHRALQDVDRGFYVDVGAYDPVEDSVTKHFYDRGWRGINIEPSSIFDHLARERPEDINLCVAVSDHSGPVTLYEVPSALGNSSLEDRPFDFDTAAPLFAGLGREHFDALYKGRNERTVQAVTLTETLAEYAADRTIDFLKIDVEGHERQVIDSNDWSRFRPRVVVIEATRPLSTDPTWQQWEGLLTGASYKFAFFDGLNRYYVRSESAELLRFFNAPANVFDGFVPLRAHRADKELSRVTAQLVSFQAEAAGRQADVLRLNGELAELHNETARRVVEAGELRTELDRRAAESAQLTAEVQHRVAESVQLAAEVKRRAAESAQLAAQVKQLTTEAMEASSVVEQQAREIESLRNEFYSLKRGTGTLVLPLALACARIVHTLWETRKLFSRRRTWWGR